MPIPFPDDPGNLAPRQAQVWTAFWQAVRDGRECGAVKLAEALGCTVSTVTSAFQSLALHQPPMLPRRGTRSGVVPPEWRLLVPRQFLADPGAFQTPCVASTPQPSAADPARA